jgi:hypothetical protein
MNIIHGQHLFGAAVVESQAIDGRGGVGNYDVSKGTRRQNEAAIKDDRTHDAQPAFR